MLALDKVVIVCGHLGSPLQCVSKIMAEDQERAFVATTTQKRVRQIIILHVGSTISAVGILGSLICLFIFFRHRLAVPTTHYLLVASSLIDLFYLSLEAIIHHPPFIVGNRNGTYLGSYISLGVLRSGINLGQLLRNWIIVCLGFERYLLVCHPMYFRTQWKLKHIHILMTVVVITCVTIRTPYVLAYIFDIWGPEWCNASEIAIALHTIFDVIFVALIPVPLLAYLSATIVMKSNRLQAWRVKMISKVDTKQSRIKNVNQKAHQAIMVVVICFTLFTVAFIPNGAFRLLKYSGFGTKCKIHFYRQVTASLVFLGDLLNSSMNFFIYMVYWARFRRAMITTLDTYFLCLKRAVVDRERPRHC
ncbi:unnamed protein product [Hydatigera taeniaeformis]|uniref:G_PROTEIN_RECEP_F1_2 domain-containing protein n=1 Tax=Hydatigena taeniaeformis TaxID=6205 RepID=A0A0R3WMF1_HYDTA|nr:unnamed protein product [Hydatigera taeniaeformis]